MEASESNRSFFDTKALKLGIMKAGMRTILVSLALGAAQSQAQIVALNERFDVSLPVVFGGLDAQAGVLISTGLGEARLDPNNNTVSTVTLKEATVTSFDEPLQGTFDPDADLGGSGFSGSAVARAGDGRANAELNLTGIIAAPSTSYPPGLGGLTVGSRALDYQLLRFNAVFDAEVEAQVSYLLTRSIMDDPRLHQTRVESLGLLQVFSLDSFVQTSANPVDDSLLGNADVALFDLFSPFSGMSYLENVQAIRVQTNTDYVVLNAAFAFVTTEGANNPTVNISASASATSSFTVADSRVSVSRSSIGSSPKSIPEPSSLALVGLALLGMRLRRR